MLELFTDPAILVGLLTLIVLEIVLGIDNLVFIAILSARLPPHQQDIARIAGLSLALLMRLALLAALSWLVTLTDPLFEIGPMEVSGRDLILFLGGLFLLYKATTELHARLEGMPHSAQESKTKATLWIVIAQIAVLDGIFSLDSVLTAIGMVDDLPVMMAAVIVAIGVMLFASKPLTAFVNAHPTVVVLCLAFLLMIGLSLVAEGLGFHLPKGYLYAAIGFSILIEFFNQMARRNYLKREGRRPARERTADLVLRLLAGPQALASEPAVAAALPLSPDEKPPFGPEERRMVGGVLELGEQSLREIMTPRERIAWIDLEQDPARTREQLQAKPHSRYPVARGSLDRLVGIVRAKDAIAQLDKEGRITEECIVPAVTLPSSLPALKAIRPLREADAQIAIVKDEQGAMQGVVTPLDILETIVEGEAPKN